MLAFCIVLAGTFYGGTIFGQTTKCLVSILDKSTSRSLSCKLVLLNENSSQILSIKNIDGTFDLTNEVNILKTQRCEIKISFENSDYFPIKTSELLCPITCPHRILADKKPDANSCKNSNPFIH